MYVVMKVNQMGMDMIMTTEVTEMKKQDIEDNIFNMTPPEGYTEMQQ